MPKFFITVYYQAKEGYEIEAETAEQALEHVMDGGELGERCFDEYLRREEILVFDDSESDEPVAKWTD